MLGVANRSLLSSKVPKVPKVQGTLLTFRLPDFPTFGLSIFPTLLRKHKTLNFKHLPLSALGRIFVTFHQKNIDYAVYLFWSCLFFSRSKW